jgi:hypothetical protein
MERITLKNVNNCWNAEITFYSKTPAAGFASVSQSSHLSFLSKERVFPLKNDEKLILRKCIDQKDQFQALYFFATYKCTQ